MKYYKSIGHVLEQTDSEWRAEPLFPLIQLKYKQNLQAYY